MVGWLPLYHDMGLIGNVLQPLHAGGRCVLMSPVSFLQRPMRWLEAISRYRGTVSGGPNFAYELCARKASPEALAGLDLSSWRVAYDGAEPVRASTLERFAEVFAPSGFKKEAFYPCYGLAEATLFVTGRPWSERGEGAGELRPGLDGSAAGGGGSGDRGRAGSGGGGGGLDLRAERGARLLGEPGGNGARLQRLPGHRRGPVPAHRGPRFPLQRRAVRHRSPEGPDHPARAQPLPAGRRADGRAGACGSAPRRRRGLLRRDGGRGAAGDRARGGPPSERRDRGDRRGGAGGGGFGA